MGDSSEGPRVKRSRFEPLPDEKQAAPQQPAKQDAGNGLSALEKLKKAKELLAKKDALKAQLQALKVRRTSAGNTRSSVMLAPVLSLQFIRRSGRLWHRAMRLQEQLQFLQGSLRAPHRPARLVCKLEGSVQALYSVHPGAQQPP